MPPEDVTFVTFIVPTIGRKWLRRTLQSFIDQHDWNWKAIVVWDGIEPNIDMGNSHITNLIVPTTHHAGLVRNEAFPYVTTKWMAFVDDDDWVAPTYVDALKMYERHYPDRDLFSFTYLDRTNGNMQPPPGSSEIVACSIGISFAVKTQFVMDHNIRFTPFAIEDFRFLDDFKHAGGKYKITNDIQYFVGGRGGWVFREGFDGERPMVRESIS
jgi:glycosyltransferase involved in cell wall biosynthesis